MTSPDVLAEEERLRRRVRPATRQLLGIARSVVGMVPTARTALRTIGQRGMAPPLATPSPAPLPTPAVTPTPRPLPAALPTPDRLLQGRVGGPVAGPPPSAVPVTMAPRPVPAATGEAPAVVAAQRAAYRYTPEQVGLVQLEQAVRPAYGSAREWVKRWQGYLQQTIGTNVLSADVPVETRRQLGQGFAEAERLRLNPPGPEPAALEGRGRGLGIGGAVMGGLRKVPGFGRVEQAVTRFGEEKAAPAARAAVVEPVLAASADYREGILRPGAATLWRVLRNLGPEGHVLEVLKPVPLDDPETLAEYDRLPGWTKGLLEGIADPLNVAGIRKLEEALVRLGGMGGRVIERDLAAKLIKDTRGLVAERAAQRGVREAQTGRRAALPTRTLATIERGPNIVYSAKTPEQAQRIVAGQERRGIYTMADPGQVPPDEGSIVMAFEATGAPVKAYKVKGAAFWKSEQLRPVSQMDIGQVHAPEELARTRPITAELVAQRGVERARAPAREVAVRESGSATAADKAYATRGVTRAERALKEAEASVRSGDAPEAYADQFRVNLDYARRVRVKLAAGAPVGEAYETALDEQRGAATRGTAEAQLAQVGITPPRGAASVTVAEIEGRAGAAKQAVEDARVAARDLARKFASEAEMRQKQATATARGVRGRPSGLTTANEVTRGEKALAAARKLYQTVKKELPAAKVNASIEDFAQRAEAGGASSEVTGILKAAYADGVRLIPGDEPLLARASWRQRLAHWAAAVEGTVPGTIGKIATARSIVESALRGQTERDLTKLVAALDEAIASEAAGLTYVGPKKVAALAEQYRPLVLVQHPDYFEGVSPRLQKLLDQAQVYQRGKLAVAEALGYPIQAIDRPYLEQVWDVPRNQLESALQRARGKVSIAKQRIFGDYIQGISAGLTPKDMTVGELVEHSSALMDKAIADAYERRLVLERFGTRTPKGFTTGYRQFADPLYRGWYAPSPISNFVDVLHNPPPGAVRALGPVAAALKNTVFGIADIGVFGVQVSEALATGGPRVVAAAINRSLELAHLPYFHAYLDENLPRVVRATLDGVHQGIGPAAVTLKGGTILKYVPFIGERLDRPVTRAIDALAQVQFGAILTPIRNMLYEGNLITLHLTGQDITDAAVRRVAADNANGLTGASRGAMTAGRRGVEAITLTSFQMRRAQIAQLGQIAKAAFSPQASAAERILAMMTLANFGAMVYGVGSAVNIAYGQGPVEFNPQKGDWASVHVGGQVLPLLPQRSLIRAIGKSITALEKEDPAQMGLIWAQFTGSGLSPLARTGPAGAGFGFEPGVGYRVGNLTGMGRLLNIAPMPPLISQVVTSFRTGEAGQRGPVALALGFTGFNPYEESPFRQLNQMAQKEFGRPLDELTPLERQQLAQGHPSQQEAIDQQQQVRAQAGDVGAQYYVRMRVINDDYNQRIADMSRTTPNDADFSDAMSKLQAERRVAVATVEGDPRYAAVIQKQRERDAEELAQVRTEKGVAPGRRLVAEYGAVFDRHEGEANPDAPGGLFEDLDAFEGSLTPKEQATLNDNLGLKLPERARARQRDNRALRNYWGQADLVWAVMQERFPELRQYRDAQSYSQVVQGQLDRRYGLGVYTAAQTRYVSVYDSALAKQRERYRIQNPSIDAILVRWYGRKAKTRQAVAIATAASEEETAIAP